MKRWTEAQANAWYRDIEWPVGMNYVPSAAVNSTEMWQAVSFDPDTIERELKWARDIGYNSLRVFLQYIVWENERGGFLETFERFLKIADANRMTVLPILFDDCAFDAYKNPTLGTQEAPVEGVHNSRWTPSPGFDIADDPVCQSALKAYVDAIIGTYRDDRRILAWDLYNEPGNSDRLNASLPLLVNVFNWARANAPAQPLTAGVWLYNDDSVYRATLELSDVISFHGYTTIERTREIITSLAALNRPLLNTEWLQRQTGNTVFDHIPLFHDEKIACFNWGFVVGKTQTNLHWSTMNGGAPDPWPAVWQHDMLHADGSPYDPEELALLKAYTRAKA